MISPGAIKELGSDLKPVVPCGRTCALVWLLIEELYRQHREIPQQPLMLEGYRQPGLWNQLTNSFSPNTQTPPPQ